MIKQRMVLKEGDRVRLKKPVTTVNGEFFDKGTEMTVACIDQLGTSLQSDSGRTISNLLQIVETVELIQ